MIILSTKDGVADKVLGFSVGADDYVTKPFDPLELRARVESRLRKKRHESAKSDVLDFGDFGIDRGKQKLFVVSEETRMETDLTTTEFKLLVFLVNNPNKICTRDEIMNAVWGSSVHIYSRNIDTHVAKLRKKLGAHAKTLQSAHGTGYWFAMPVVEKNDHFPASLMSMMDEEQGRV